MHLAPVGHSEQRCKGMTESWRKLTKCQCDEVSKPADSLRGVPLPASMRSSHHSPHLRFCLPWSMESTKIRHFFLTFQQHILGSIMKFPVILLNYAQVVNHSFLQDTGTTCEPPVLVGRSTAFYLSSNNPDFNKWWLLSSDTGDVSIVHSYNCSTLLLNYIYKYIDTCTYTGARRTWYYPQSQIITSSTQVEELCVCVCLNISSHG